MSLGDAELSRLHQIQLELLAELQRVCNRHGIKYFALYGTALGAIRHQGFIPWDDDLDIGMVREDYDRFVKVAPSELLEQYFFQTCATDKSYASPLGKLRKNGTTFRELSVGDSGQHSGIFIDIFPLDARPSGWLRERVHKWSTYVMIRLLMIKGGYVIGTGSSGRRPVRRMAGLLSRCITRGFIVRSLERQLRRFNGEDASLLISGAGPYGYDKETLDANWVSELELVPFGALHIPIFTASDSYLSRLYGDYMTPPPSTAQMGHHFLAELDFGEL